MKREWNVLTGEAGEVGDDAAKSKAFALAELADAGLLDTLLDAVVMLRRIGGQFYLTAHRAKFDASGELIPTELARETPGRWETAGFLCAYESRAAHLEPLEPPAPRSTEELLEERGAAEAEAEEPLAELTEEEVADLEAEIREEEPVETG